mmetsp:Transcript_12926/g.40792  ORF Transcript_12926/g.40792 Transcript_12926/m.40792 type:complete len:255 (-) Transcript_12926:1109-1873(-)
MHVLEAELGIRRQVRVPRLVVLEVRLAHPTPHEAPGLELRVGNLQLRLAACLQGAGLLARRQGEEEWLREGLLALPVAMEDLREPAAVGPRVGLGLGLDPHAVVEDVGLAKAGKGADLGLRPVDLVQPAVHHLQHAERPTKAPLGLDVLLRLHQQVAHGAGGRHEDDLAADLAHSVVVEPHAQGAQPAVQRLAPDLRRQLHGVQGQGPLCRRGEVGGRALQLLERELLMAQGVGVERLLARGAGRGMEEPELGV